MLSTIVEFDITLAILAETVTGPLIVGVSLFVDCRFVIAISLSSMVFRLFRMSSRLA